jgi:hypothetical protein
MGSKGFTGKGTVFSIGSGGAGETFTAVAQLKTLQLSGAKINFEDISNLDSPVLASGQIVLKENMSVTADLGTMAVAGLYLPMDTGKQAMDTAYDGLPHDFKIQLPKGPGQTTAGNLFAFSGIIAENPKVPDIQFDKILNFKTTIQLTTDINVTPGSLLLFSFSVR